MLPGGKAPVFKTRLGRIGLAICWDLAFPEHFRDLALAGAELAVCPSYWHSTDRYGRYGADGDALNDRLATGRRVARLVRAEDFFIDSCASARAAENAMAVAFVNFAGRTQPNVRGERLVGASQIVSPLAGVIARTGDRPGIVIGEVDLDLVADAERIYGVRADARAVRRGRLPGDPRRNRR